MSKIAINVSRLNPADRTRGIGVYSQALIKALLQINSNNQYVLATQKNHLKNADLVHYPNFDFFFLSLPLRQPTKSVITIHDVTPLVFPKHFPPGLRGKVKFRIQLRALTNINAIITDSENSKADISKYLNVPSSKIHVVYLGVSKDFKPAPSKSVPKKPYLLYVGDVNYNKNVHVLITAFSKLKNTNLDLLVVSNAWENSHLPEIKALNRLIKKLNLTTRVKKINYLSSLVNLYRGARVYVQPSLYEGFGLPVLEAMASGTPVVATNVASIPEVAGSAAIMVKPQVEAIAQGITKALNLDNRQRRVLISKGLRQSKKFSWEKTAKQTNKIYEQILAA